MQKISYPQLYANKVLDFPLPVTDNSEEYCRECGGPIQAGTGISKKYRDSWVDEALILYSEGRKVCPACEKLSEGSSTRTKAVPPKGKVVVVSPKETWPSPERLYWCHDDKAKDKLGEAPKEYIYSDCPTFLEFIRQLPNIAVPFGVTIGGGQGVKEESDKRHFYRNVPLNYQINDFILGLVLPRYEHFWFRWKILQTLAEAELTPEEAKTQYNLSFSETKLYQLICFNKTKEE